MIPRKSILIVPLFIISLSYVVHSQPLYKWVDEEGNKHFTTRYEDIPPEYRDQVPKPERVDEPKPTEEEIKREKAEEVEPKREPQPEKKRIVWPVTRPRVVPHKPNYVALKGGIYSPQSDDLEDFETGFNGEISVGHFFHPNFALELAIGYFETEDSVSGFIPALGNFTRKDEITAVPVTLAAKGIYPIGRGELFAAGGIGVYYIEGETDISTSALGRFAFDGDDGVFGFHLGLGGHMNIAENLFLGIEGKYLWAEAEFEGSLSGVPIELNADLEGFTATANLGLRF